MIEHWSKGPADDNMPEEMLVSTLQRVRQHPWWWARASLALALLTKYGISPAAPVFDVGCGWGVTLGALEHARYEAVGFDISLRILSMIDAPSRRLVEADLTQPLPPQATQAEALLALDVIEHLDDDRGALEQMTKLLKPGGLAIVSVPALPELYSDFDAMQGHRRRYLPETLRASFDRTGLEVRTIFWWGAWMIPILRRMRQQPASDKLTASRTYADYLKLPRWPGPLLMKLAYAYEQSKALDGRLQTGTSLFAIAERAN